MDVSVTQSDFWSSIIPKDMEDALDITERYVKEVLLPGMYIGSERVENDGFMFRVFQGKGFYVGIFSFYHYKCDDEEYGGFAPHFQKWLKRSIEKAANL